ncbi:packaged DNA stabilization protein gp10 [Xylella fastidiosa subsp. multiplex]|uniref:Packaged DNA stabilization protein gp10 n=2 Tax=Xylella fastidiosa TaxID=2371 RepID=A0AAW6HW15_XYLFS|nr:packaged DNA stabilization protein [Xylella fastidiosa]MCH7233546.1 packaged DNA stabilization protein gp10 [Xylella fastidiosa subsp. multiplex]MDC6408793.1 packaged DNA stabilization protein gp10 [Xylella fastidiosa subsp. multiplex]MDD0936685.1 packaged DNA stabilization protein gp10 [Xylella fastidiosa subsp. multiplex]MSS67839.1 hypothetical protein [Xylella fastidiosa subsp. multiplex]
MIAQWRDAPIIGGAYSDETLPWSVQDTVNWIPVKAERSGGRSSAMLRCAPGARIFCVPDPAPPAPVRGLHDVEGTLFAVVGNTLWQITAAGTAIHRGNIPGSGRVVMAHHQITGGNKLAIANGVSGYVYNTATETAATQISDAAFPGFKACDYVDNYIVGVEPAGRFWFHSDLADATRYNTLDRYEAESAPDAIIGLMVIHREVLILGARTGEFFINTGAVTGTFQRHSGTEMQIGCASHSTVQRLANTAVWLGHDGSVYRLDGYQPVRVSTQPLEQAIARCNHAEAFAFTFEDRGHQIYYLSFPDGMTWGYDAATAEWHRRESFGMRRWRMSCCIRHNTQWIAGDFTNGTLYILDWLMPWEGDHIIERRRVSGVFHGNQNRLNVNALELVFGTDAHGGATPAPTIEKPPPASEPPAKFIPCGVMEMYSGGEAFPNVVHVRLGSATGLVTLAFATSDNPDKFEVWIGGVKVLDTGYYGNVIYQTQLDAVLKNKGLPPEKITQIRAGGSDVPETVFAHKNYETAIFRKTTADAFAEVRVYSPITGTKWCFSMDCPT